MRKRTTFALLGVLLLFTRVPAQATAVIVPARQPKPPLPTLEIAAGRVAELDVITTDAVPAESEYRHSLYLLGGPLATLVASKTDRIAATSEPGGGSRIPFRVEIPAVSAGTRFLFKVERVKQPSEIIYFLGETELRVEETLNLFAERASFLVNGSSQRLRDFFSAKHLLAEASGKFRAPGIVLTEDKIASHSWQYGAPAVVIICKESTGSLLCAMAMRDGKTWIVNATLPHFSHLGDNTEAERELAEVLRFALQLPPVSSTPAHYP